MKILFVIDKVELKYFEFNNLVTNFWLIKEFLERSCEVCITTIPQLYLSGKTARTKCYESFVSENNIFYKNNILDKEIDSFDLVMFRPDPPVDINYINATYIFDISYDSILLGGSSKPNTSANSIKAPSLLSYFLLFKLENFSRYSMAFFLTMEIKLFLSPF